MLNTLKHITQANSIGSFNKSSSVVSQFSNSSKCYYVEENTKLLEKNLRKASPILQDLLEKVNFKSDDFFSIDDVF